MSKGTTRRTVRIDDELWEAAKDQAETEGLDVSDLMRQLLRGWLNMKATGAEEHCNSSEIRCKIKA